MVPVFTALATLLLAASSLTAGYVRFHQSTAHLPGCGACALVAGLVLGLVACLQVSSTHRGDIMKVQRANTCYVPAYSRQLTTH